MTDKVKAEQIAQLVIESLPWGTAVSVLLLLAVVIVGLWFKVRIKENAKIKEVSANIEEIKTQLAETTRVTEGIKHEIEHHHWRQKEIEQLKRGKLEEYLKDAARALSVAIAFSRGTLNDYEHGINSEIFDQLHVNINTLHGLYFQELAEQHKSYVNALVSLMTYGIKQKKQFIEEANELGKLNGYSGYSKRERYDIAFSRSDQSIIETMTELYVSASKSLDALYSEAIKHSDQLLKG